MDYTEGSSRWRLHGRLVPSPPQLTLNGPPFPSSSSRMYPSTAMVESGGCFHDNVALLF